MPRKNRKYNKAPYWPTDSNTRKKEVKSWKHPAASKGCRREHKLINQARKAEVKIRMQLAQRSRSHFKISSRGLIYHPAGAISSSKCNPNPMHLMPLPPCSHLWPVIKEKALSKRLAINTKNWRMGSLPGILKELNSHRKLKYFQ